MRVQEFDELRLVLYSRRVIDGQAKQLGRTHQTAVETVAALTATTGDWPTYAEVLIALDRKGLHAPQFRIEDICDSLILLSRPPKLGDQVALSAVGWRMARPEAPEIHEGFVFAVRRCVDSARLWSPGANPRNQGLYVRAVDLWDSRLPRRQLRIVGLLLEVEKFGAVTWDLLDQTSPFTIELDALRVRRFASVGYFSDYERVVIAA